MKGENPLTRPSIPSDKPVRPPQLDVYLPATPPLNLIATLEFWVKAYLRRRHFRGLFLPLLNEQDSLTELFGCKPEDIIWAANLPLEKDAVKALVLCRSFRGE